MKGHKILRDHFITVTYSENHLKLLHHKRERSKTLLEMFAKEGLNPFIYGSIARGDIHNDSDIDMVLIQTIAPYQIEIILDKNGFNNYFREIIMATPADTLKLYIYLNELEAAKQLSVSINLINERKRVLLRREKFGKTGVFLKRSIEMNETTEDVLKKLANEKSIVRKKLLQR